MPAATPLRWPDRSPAATSPGSTTQPPPASGLPQRRLALQRAGINLASHAGKTGLTFVWSRSTHNNRDLEDLHILGAVMITKLSRFFLTAFAASALLPAVSAEARSAKVETTDTMIP